MPICDKEVILRDAGERVAHFAYKVNEYTDSLHIMIYQSGTYISRAFLRNNIMKLLLFKKGVQHRAVYANLKLGHTIICCISLISKKHKRVTQTILPFNENPKI